MSGPTAVRTLPEHQALSNHSGKLQLHLHESNKGAHSILASKERTSTVTVDAISLDEYLKDHPGRVDLVKIDTEGAEGIVLDGIFATLSTDIPSCLLSWNSRRNYSVRPV